MLARVQYAVETRYPGPVEPVTEEEYQQAVVLAETVIRWVAQLIDLGGKEML